MLGARNACSHHRYVCVQKIVKPSRHMLMMLGIPHVRRLRDLIPRSLRNHEVGLCSESPQTRWMDARRT
jgi:hypothetical protein